MEKEKATLTLIEKDLKEKMSKLINCKSQDLPNAFRSLNECVQSYCTFRTLFEKYNFKDSAE